MDVDGEDVPLTAHFRVAERYNVIPKVDDASHGSVSGGGTYYEGAVVRLVATPNTGYRFVEWTDEEGNWVFNNATFVLYPEDYSYIANNNNEIKFVAHFESITSYYSQTLKTIDGPFNDGYSLLDAVPALSNYSQCCLEVTYTGNPTFSHMAHFDWGDQAQNVQLNYANQTTTDYVEIPTNGLKINSGGGNISKIVVRVKP